MALDSSLAVLVAPFADMVSSPIFFAEVVVGGLMAGVMYAMVALGFVLIFKASGVFNFAQGVMVLFAALTLVGLMEHGMPVWLALVITAVVMIVLAFAIERVVLRPLVNQSPFTLLMATIGLAFLSQKTSIGRALRAVADDHQAATAVGIPLQTIWVTVWSVAGIVALVGGIMWGAKSGVQFSLSLIALKALPVLILGGLTSIPGAIVGGLIIGVGEKIAEVYWGPLVGGAIENWFAYVLAMVFLLFRPQGLFGEEIIERV